MKNLGTLYIVATPIGNLEDLTARASRILKESSFVVCEDTRVSSILLKSIGSSAKTLSLHAHSSVSSYVQILKYLEEGLHISYVTDAGTPGISDPGNELVSFIRKTSPNISIVPIPGVSSLTTISSVSGMNLRQFTFAGFVPKKKTQKFFKVLLESDRPFIFLDSPHRILKNLDTLITLNGGSLECVVGRELTKLHETIVFGTIEEVRTKLSDLKVIKGELTIIVSASKNAPTD